MKLTPDDLRERALWLCEAMAELETHNQLTKEILAERRMRAKAIAANVEKLRREVLTGEAEAEQLEIEGAR